MDGIHDLGGRQGFGPVEPEDSDEQFHEAWEARVRGMVHAMTPAPDWSLDWFRHCRELIEPTDYLTRPYFDQWAQSYAAMLVNSGLASVEEIARGSAAAPLEGLPAPMSAADAKAARPGRKSFHGEVDAAPVFAPGDAVRAKAHASPGHTRLPAYVRGRRGRIERHYAAHVLPDANALGDKRHEHLYIVGFDAAELWPEAQSRRETVLLNLWESYLERV